MYRPKYIFVPPWMHYYIANYRSPFEAVANRKWLFRTFGIKGA